MCWLNLSVFRTADMHWLAFVTLANSGNKFFRRGPNICPGGSKLNVTPTRGWDLGMKIISLLPSLLSLSSPPFYYSAVHDLPHHPRCTASGYDHCWWVSLENTCSEGHGIHMYYVCPPLLVVVDSTPSGEKPCLVVENLSSMTLSVHPSVLITHTLIEWLAAWKVARCRVVITILYCLVYAYITTVMLLSEFISA